MKHFTYKTSGVCSREISFDLSESGTLHNVRFLGGCDGNLKAIGKITEGMPADEVRRIFEGNTCNGRPTSCADQLSKAISKAQQAAEAGE